MKKVTKKSLVSIFACFLACIMFAMPVYAASSSFSKTTVKLNAINGSSSVKSTLSSGSVLGSKRSINSVQLFCNVSSNSDPYTIYVQSPSGTVESLSGPSRSSTVSVGGFLGEDPKGTWTVWIVNSGISYKGNVYPASTATITLKVSYTY